MRTAVASASSRSVGPLGVSASAYYQRATGQRSQRAVDDARLLAVIEDLHAANYHAYGYRRTWKARQRAGESVGRDRVRRLMRHAGIQGAKRRGKPWRTTTPHPAALRAPDRVERDFTADGPDELWLADFTYLRCWEGVVFFSFVIDAFSRRIVGWQFASHMRSLLPEGPNAALRRRLFLLITDRVWRTRCQLELAVVEYVGWFNDSRLISSAPGGARGFTLCVVGRRSAASPP
jgi:hypothetical protein